MMPTFVTRTATKNKEKRKKERKRRPTPTILIVEEACKLFFTLLISLA